MSPDGRWLAHASNEPGSSAIYLQRFPALGERYTVSTGTGSGSMPTWSHDGGAIYYLRSSGGPPREVMRVTIRATAAGRPDIGLPEVVQDFRSFSSPRGRRHYDVADRDRLLMISTDDATTAGAEPRQIHIVTNWFEELKRLVPIR
jgi:hypothetical protein